MEKSTVSKPISGHPMKITRDQILKDIEQYLMIILMNVQNVLLSVHMQYLMCYMLQEYRVKKDVKADPDHRQQFQNLIECLERQLPLIYIDESGFQSESTRLHSYSLKGVRAEGEFNWQLKNCSNAIGALIENRLLTVEVFNCSVNTAVFECWIEQDLLPKLKKTSFLIMNNAPFHKGKRLQELVRCAGHYIV